MVHIFDIIIMKLHPCVTQLWLGIEMELKVWPADDAKHIYLRLEQGIKIDDIDL